MEVVGYLHLFPMRGMGDVAIPNHMCSGMDYPHSELPSKKYSDATLDLPLFDADHMLVASFVVVE